MHCGLMDAFWCPQLTFFLLLLLQAMCSDIAEEMTRAVGESVTFQLKKLDGKSVVWNFGNGAIATVIFGDPPDPVLVKEDYKPRLTFPKNGTALTISQLTMDDAGTYVADTNLLKITFTLHVYRELPVPTVTCVAQNCSADDCRYTLRCATEGSGFGNVSYDWNTGDQVWQKGPMVVLEVSAMNKPPAPLMCVAQNPVSRRNITVISPADVCAGTYSSRQALIVVSVIGAAVLLAAVVFVVCCTRRGWRIFHLPTAKPTDTGARAGAEDSTVYAQVGPSQQRDLQNFSNTQQDDPKKAPIPDMDNSRTIYFTVQAVPQTDDEKMGNNVPGCRKQDEKSHHLLVS